MEKKSFLSLCHCIIECWLSSRSKADAGHLNEKRDFDDHSSRSVKNPPLKTKETMKDQGRKVRDEKNRMTTV